MITECQQRLLDAIGYELDSARIALSLVPPGEPRETVGVFQRRTRRALDKLITATVRKGDHMNAPQRFTRNPVTVEAMQWLPETNAEQVLGWLRSHRATFEFLDIDKPLLLWTLWSRGAPAAVMVGDWIVRGVEDGFSPRAPDIFEATYELATNETNGEL